MRISIRLIRWAWLSLSDLVPMSLSLPEPRLIREPGQRYYPPVLLG
jgi:hypothetical protein